MQVDTSFTSVFIEAKGAEMRHFVKMFLSRRTPDKTMCVAVRTLVGGDERDILGGRRHAQDLVAIYLPLYLRQVAKGAGDACRKVWNVTHLHQQLHQDTNTCKQC